MKSKKEKLFIIRKYVMATDASDAIRRERKADVDDLWVDDEWRKNNLDQLTKNIGFTPKK